MGVRRSNQIMYPIVRCLSFNEIGVRVCYGELYQKLIIILTALRDRKVLLTIFTCEGNKFKRKHVEASFKVARALSHSSTARFLLLSQSQK